MNILMLNYEYPPLGGGSGNATYYMLRELSRHNDISVDAVVSSTGVYREERIADNIRIHFLDIGKRGGAHYQTDRDLIAFTRKALAFCRGMARENEYDLCHAFFGIPCGFVARLLGLPYIVSLRGSDVPFFNKRFAAADTILFRRMSRHIWSRAAAVIANSSGLKGMALRSAPGMEISVIQNGVDAEEFRPADDRPVAGAVRAGPIRLISVGRLIGRKGYGYLIKALSGKRNFRLEIIGEGPLLGRLEEVAEECGASVAFLGGMDHSGVIEALRRADIFVLPSLNEGMSNSVLEAMACGLPVITTDVGGADELVRGNGYIVEKASAPELLLALEVYRGDGALMRRHGEASRKLAEEMGWDRCAGRYMGIYRAVSRV